jgi:DNA-binding LytR/AlgR family response regulator
MLQRHPEIEVVGEAENSESALFKFMAKRPEIVFLDLVMPGKNGTEFISLIRKEKLDTNIVIVSSYHNMAIDAIKNEVYDFLLKPVNAAKLETIITTIKNRKLAIPNAELDALFTNVKNDQKLKLSSINSHIVIDPKEILYCEAEGSYTHIHLDNGSIELANTYLGKMEEILGNDDFFRIGRSHLINLDKLKSVNRFDNSCVLTAKKKEVKLYGSKKQIRELCKIETKEEN